MPVAALTWARRSGWTGIMTRRWPVDHMRSADVSGSAFGALCFPSMLFSDSSRLTSTLPRRIRFIDRSRDHVYVKDSARG
jgi:hypothetical protein